MKPLSRIVLFLIVTLFALLLSACSVAENTSGVNFGQVMVGDAYRLSSGQTLNHDLTVIGGNVTIEKDAAVDGNVSVVGGNVNIDGKINGDLSTIGGNVSLQDDAVVQGQVNTLGGRLQRSSKAVVQGEILRNNRPSGPIATLRNPLMQANLDPITGPLMAIFQALALAALAVVVSLFLPALMQRTGQTAASTPAAAGGVGCLTLLVLLVMGITIILIPVSILGFLVAGVAMLFGWLTIGMLLGRQMAVWMRQPWTDPVSAGAGTLTLSLLGSMLSAIPCIGWTVPALVGLIGLGAVVLSRFGTQVYPAPYRTYASGQSPLYAPTAPPQEPRYGAESDRPREEPPSEPPAAGL